MFFFGRRMNVQILAVIADAPKRAVLKDVEGHTSFLGCGMCQVVATSMALQHTRKPDTSKLVWHNHFAAAPKTDEWHRQCLKDNVPKKVCGIKGWSMLLDIPGFDMMYGVLPEYMHSMCLGTVQQVFELTFKTSQAPRLFSRAQFPRIHLAKLHNELNTVLVPREFSRRARSMEIGVWKAEEYRNLILFFFPAVIKVMRNLNPPNLIEMELTRSIQLWASLAFVLRACCLQDEEYNGVDKSMLWLHQGNFLKQLDRLHGSPGNFTYNVHQVLHLVEMRSVGPLPELSAFPFEGSYNNLKRSFHRGTPNIGKQMMEVFYHRNRLGHACVKTIKAEAKVTNFTDDSNVYIYDRQEQKHHFYKVMATGQNSLCVVKRETQAAEEQNIPWHQVGVYKCTCNFGDSEWIETRMFNGKAMIVADNILTVPSSCLRETA